MWTRVPSSRSRTEIDGGRASPLSLDVEVRSMDRTRVLETYIEGGQVGRTFTSTEQVCITLVFTS